MNKKRTISLLIGIGALLLISIPLVISLNRPEAAVFAPCVPQGETTSAVPESKDSQKDDIFELFNQNTQQSFSLPGKELVTVSLLCEMDPSAPGEALKAQAVACYTLFSRMRLNRETIPCNPEEWLTWTDAEHITAKFGGQAEEVVGRVREQVESVYGQCLCQDGRPILSLYSAVNTGITASSSAVLGVALPYLEPVASPGDRLSPDLQFEKTMSAEEVRKALQEWAVGQQPVFDVDQTRWIVIDARETGGYVSRATLGGIPCSGEVARQVLGLRSSAFDAESTEAGFHFTGQGWGTGLGMSQAGAISMAEQGASYGEILAWYYPGTNLIDAQRN